MKAQLSSYELHYEKIIPESIGNEDVVILFLHEALGSIGQWKNFPQKICDLLELEGIVYERRGHGLSSPLASERGTNYLHHYALTELPEFLETIGETRKILLVGHSDGGTIALLFGAQYPNRIAGTVTMAAHVINEPETVAGIDPAVKAWQAGKLDGLKKYHGDKTQALFYAWADIWRNPEFHSWDITKEIAFPNGNGLFIQGADDQYGTEKQITLIASNFKGKSKAEILENCGHHPHLEQSEAVSRLIKDWWNG